MTDKIKLVIFITMNRFIYTHQPKSKDYNQNKKELVSFVADQFKKLAKKNLRIPIQLYHL